MKRMIRILSCLGVILTTSGGTPRSLQRRSSAKRSTKRVLAAAKKRLQMRIYEPRKTRSTRRRGTSTLSLSGARSCVVNNSVPTTTDYSCAFPLESSAAAEERYQQVVGHVKTQCSLRMGIQGANALHRRQIRPFGHGEQMTLWKSGLTLFPADITEDRTVKGEVTVFVLRKVRVCGSQPTGGRVGSRGAATGGAPRRTSTPGSRSNARVPSNASRNLMLQRFFLC